MQNLKNDPNGESLAKLMKKNLRLTEQILEHTKKTRRYILFAQILSVVKVVLIVGPIIVAIIFLPPLIREFLNTYSNLFGSGTSGAMLEGGGFLEKIFGEKP